MEGPRAMSQIPCCTCGTPTEPNSRGQCLACIQAAVDITERIPRMVGIDRCSVCGAWHRNPQWIHAELESQPLLALCLKKLKGFSQGSETDSTSRVKLVDASFVWTEPHSKRLKVKLTVRGEVLGSVTLEQQCVVEYKIFGGQCRECERAASKQTWQACVQLRQRASKARVLHMLEQLILAEGAALTASEIKPAKEGIDFYFPKRQAAEKLVALVSQYSMARVKASKQLVTHNEKNGTANLRFTWAVEVAPVCKDDLVCLPRATLASLGGSPLRLVAKASRALHLVDPLTAEVAICSESQYWKEPFQAVLSRRAGKQYTVLDVEVDGAGRRPGSAAPADAPRFVRGDAQVVRGEDYGTVQQVFTHLGRILAPGDTALGYDLGSMGLDEDLRDVLPAGMELPDTVLFAKVNPERRKFRKRKGTHTGRKGRARGEGSEAGTETSSVVSATESELMGREMDDYLDRLAAQEAEGELLDAGEALAALDLEGHLDTLDESEEEVPEEGGQHPAAAAPASAPARGGVPRGGDDLPKWTLASVHGAEGVAAPPGAD